MAKHYGVSSKENKVFGWLNKFIKPGDSRLPSGWVFPDSITCLALGLESNPARIADESVRLQLFFDDGIENAKYAEF